MALGELDHSGLITVEEYTMEISVIIPTYNRFEDLNECLKSLIDQTLVTHEILLIDDSESDSIRNYADKIKPVCRHASIQLDYIKNHRGKSLTIARNVGLDHISGDIILFLDDDVILEKDYLAKLSTTFRENPHISGLQGLVTNWPARSPAQKLFFTFAKKILHPKYDCFVTPSWLTVYDPRPYKELSSCEWFSGCNQAYRRQVFDNLRFDEQLKKYSSGEDIDFSYRVSRKYPNSLFLLSTAQCVHNMSPAGRMPNEKKIIMQIVYATYFYYKNIPQTTRNFIFLILGRIGFFAIEGCNILQNHKERRIAGFIAMIKGTILAFKYRATLKKGDLSFMDQHI